MPQIIDQQALNDASAAGPEVIEVPIRITGLVSRIVRLVIFFTLVWIVLLQLPAFMLIRGTAVGSVIVVYACAILVSILMGVVPWIQRRRALSRVVRLLHEYDEGDDQDPRSLAERVHGTRKWFERRAGLVFLISGLGSRQPGLVFRFAPRAHHPPIEPIAVPFEARLLDETEPGFSELWNATLASGEGAGAESLPGADESPGLRRVIRNIRLKEGWFMTLLFLALFANSAYEDYLVGRITVWTIIWAVFLARVFFAPATRNTGEGTWFIVPGGVLIRRVNEKKEVVHRLVDRKSSVLGVFMETRHRWSIVVSDESDLFSRAATAREATMLLRAWTSPIEPPSKEVIAHMA